MQTTTNSQVLERIKSSKSLPSPPGVALKILELDKSENASLDEIARLVSADPVLTSKLIQFCNSPMIGLGRSVTNLNQAVLALGMRSLKMLALSFSLVDRSKHSSSADLTEFWRTSLARAVASQTVCNTVGLSADDAFIAALVSGIGHLAMSNEYPEEWEIVESELTQDGTPQSEIEKRVFGITCSEVAIELLRHWSFPEPICSLVMKINEQSTDGLLEKSLYVAHLMVHLVEHDNTELVEIEEFRSSVSRLLSLDQKQQDALFEEFLGCWNEFATILSYDQRESKPLAEMEREAQSRLISHSLNINRENLELTKQTAVLAANALTDPLTNLGNRRALDERGEQQLAQIKRMEKSMVVLMLDIDHFKKVNDTYGHPVGDKVLQNVAKCLQNNSRTGDLLFRYGGEEFLMLLPDCSPDAACVVAERCRLAVEQSETTHEQTKIRVTVSIGAACAAPPIYPALDEVLAAADARLYNAKKFGRNRCSFPQMQN